ncbi:hypothetical protein J8631_25460 [Serratia fonticola]|uniref:hypothetical protein n=1 Tax=Serratia fonticola TaxID=47917 RepID=UPI001AE7A460|nr:hypothetical protein [Serratia fonticola]MBP1038919.1 hypothetical protein [Serratia fonticola]
MLTHKQVMEEVRVIVEEISSSDEKVLPFSELAKPVGKVVLLATLLTFIGTLCDFYFHLEGAISPLSSSIFITFCTFVIGVVLIACSMKFCSAYYMISSETRKNSKVLALIRCKIKSHVRINSILWVFTTIIYCFYGNAPLFVPVFIFITSLASYVILSADFSRYELSGLFGVMKSAGDVFKNY